MLRRCDRAPDSAATVFQSLRLLLDSDVDCELRTTVHPQLLDESTSETIRRQLAAFQSSSD